MLTMVVHGKVIFSGDKMLADSMYQNGTLPDGVLKYFSYSPTPEQYQAGMARHYKVCEKKTHKTGFKFWNEYKKSRDKDEF